MKSTIVLLIATILCISVESAQSQSCCKLPPQASVSQMIPAMFSRSDFLKAHAAPLPFHYDAEKGTIIEFPTPGGGPALGRAFYVQSAKPTNRYLLIFHEWWGLNDYIKQEAERWQKKLGNINVMAIDLFDGNVATTPEEAQKLVQSVKPERAMAIINGALAHMRPGTKIATLGWCYGGGYALQASLAAGSLTRATVMYYGMPEFDQAKLGKLQGPVIEFFGSKDAFIDKTKRVQFEHAMKTANKHLETRTYQGAPHAFANPSNPQYDKKAAADANKRAEAFLKKYFR